MNYQCCQDCLKFTGGLTNYDYTTVITNECNDCGKPIKEG